MGELKCKAFLCLYIRSHIISRKFLVCWRSNLFANNSISHLPCEISTLFDKLAFFRPLVPTKYICLETFTNRPCCIPVVHPNGSFLQLIWRGKMHLVAAEQHHLASSSSRMQFHLSIPHHEHKLCCWWKPWSLFLLGEKMLQSRTIKIAYGMLKSTVKIPTLGKLEEIMMYCHSLTLVDVKNLLKSKSIFI